MLKEVMAGLATNQSNKKQPAKCKQKLVQIGRGKWVINRLYRACITLISLFVRCLGSIIAFIYEFQTNQYIWVTKASKISMWTSLLLLALQSEIRNYLFLSWSHFRLLFPLSLNFILDFNWHAERQWSMYSFKIDQHTHLMFL